MVMQDEAHGKTVTTAFGQATKASEVRIGYGR